MRKMMVFAALNRTQLCITATFTDTTRMHIVSDVSLPWLDLRPK
jgi:hypothetical protein